MAGPGFTQTFGGAALFPAQSTYQEIQLATNVILLWPVETSIAGTPVVTNIIDVNPAQAGLSIMFSSAEQTNPGYTALFNNVGAFSFNVTDAGGNVLATIASGTAWVLYLADNSTVNGVWRLFQMGAGVSNANAAALAGAGLKAIGTTLNQNYAVNAQNANYAFAVSDRSTAVEWTGGTGSGVLPVGATATSGWFVIVKNSGSGIWTLSVSGGADIDGAPSLALDPEQSCYIVCDGANYFTVGLGQQLNSIFDFIQISLAGDSGDVVLSGAQLNRISYRFTGALAGNVNIIVPNTVQQYWVDNETTGAFTLTVKTATGSGFVVGQTDRQILYCDGTNVVSAVTVAITLPVPINQGGTAATTASAALANLGGGTTGIAVFESITQANAAAALGLPIITFKPADTTRNTTGPTADPDLAGIALTAGGVYAVEVNIGLLSQSSNTDGLTYGIAYSGGSFQPSNFVWLLRSGGVQGIINNTTSTVVSLNDTLYAKFILEATAAGNLSFNWAQSTNSGSGGQTVQKGSYISVQRIV